MLHTGTELGKIWYICVGLLIIILKIYNTCMFSLIVYNGFGLFMCRWASWSKTHEDLCIGWRILYAIYVPNVTCKVPYIMQSVNGCRDHHFPQQSVNYCVFLQKWTDGMCKTNNGMTNKKILYLHKEKLTFWYIQSQIAASGHRKEGNSWGCYSKLVLYHITSQWTFMPGMTDILLTISLGGELWFGKGQIIYKPYH